MQAKRLNSHKWKYSYFFLILKNTEKRANYEITNDWCKSVWIYKKFQLHIQDEYNIKKMSD